MVNKVNNEIHFLQFTILLTASVYTYLSPNFHLLFQKQIVQVLPKLFLSTCKALRFYTSSNMAVSGNLTVDLLVITFSPSEGRFMPRSLCADLVIVEKVRTVANC